MSIAEAQAKHHQAMICVDNALLAQRSGDNSARRTHLEQAYILEREAADAVANERDVEPTRSILHRSAANLAIQCGHTQQAEQLIAVGLAGDPPADVAEELRQLLAQIKPTLNGSHKERGDSPQPSTSKKTKDENAGS